MGEGVAVHQRMCSVYDIANRLVIYTCRVYLIQYYSQDKGGSFVHWKKRTSMIRDRGRYVSY